MKYSVKKSSKSTSQKNQIRKHKAKSFYLLFILILLIFAIFLVVAYIYNKQLFKINADQISSITPTVKNTTKSPLPTLTKLKKDTIIQFSSTQLGVSFSYPRYITQATQEFEQYKVEEGENYLNVSLENSGNVPFRIDYISNTYAQKEYIESKKISTVSDLTTFILDGKTVYEYTSFADVGNQRFVLIPQNKNLLRLTLWPKGNEPSDQILNSIKFLN